MSVKYPFPVTKSARLGGRLFEKVATVEGEVLVSAVHALPAAKAGQLTTRTSATVGTLTMAGGHGITTAARLDIYWTEGGVDGIRRGVTVGTVSGNSVPFSLGAGDNLPTNLTDITAMVPVSKAFEMDGDNMVGLALKCEDHAQCCVVLAESDDTENAAYGMQVDAFIWYDSEGPDNPLATFNDIHHVFLSHKDSAAGHDIVVSALLA